MLSLYRPGDGPLHRMPAGPSMLLVAIIALGVAALPSVAWTAAVCAGVVTVAYAASGLQMRELGRQLRGLRWILAITAIGQLVFLGPEPALANTARVAAALLVATLLPLTTRVDDVLDALERALRPLRRVGMDAERAALLLAVTITTVPVLARLAAEVREAQRARGVRPSLLRGALSLLIAALRHADALGEGLAARGIR
ncbi:biotin transport system permease protein [Microbacterium sp. ru370.1]|uniref:CbiQ family ECF transporter T component n=1 Tax=unclassified Microbacterium TaxID=2609290 RepID=UPI00088B527E|nr:MULTISPECIES: CbiQ family ECF transporter T component [unclassified Microbacterium]SDO28061.1 biotin transport system permease protein [Microbacterium sp. ru370.1]SIT75039.1 biotin transport system permease protein [Microbacterium sp. RU1D]